MKGIILAGGSGTRLYPLTKALSKQLLPIYDKPLIYYPLSVLLLAGIRDILIISTPEDVKLIQKLFEDGSDYGVNISYAVQEKPRGIAEAFIIGKDFIGKERIALVLGDNIFYSPNLEDILLSIIKVKSSAMILGYYVNNPSQYGVVEIDSLNNVISITEKPIMPKSNYIIPGLYFYDNSVVDIARELKPSARGELEISSVNSEYVRQKKIKIHLLDQSVLWIDAGSPDRLLYASNCICSIQKETQRYVSCIEEIAFKKGLIDKSHFIELAEKNMNTIYMKYLLSKV